MPVYSYQCNKCDRQFEGYVAQIGGSLPCTCGSVEVEKIWSVTKHLGGGIYPYVTKNLDPSGKPVEVTGPKHLEQLCKQFGVTHRPDVAWTTQEYLGYDWRTKKQRYKESSGMGLPGVWF